MKSIPLLSGAIVIGLALSATVANAFPIEIEGSISFSDGFDNLPVAGTPSIVSALTSFDVQSTAQAFGGTTDFSGTNGDQTSYDFNISNLPASFFDTDTGVIRSEGNQSRI